MNRSSEPAERNESDEEGDRLNTLKQDETYFKTLTRNQRYSLTRRIQAEYNRAQRKVKRQPIPTEWREDGDLDSQSDSQVALKTYRHRSASENDSDGRHLLRLQWNTEDKNVLPNVRLLPPDVGTTAFYDISETEITYIQTTALLQLDDILTSRRFMKPVKLRKPKTVPNLSNIFECDLQTIIAIDRTKTKCNEIEIPVLFERLLQSSSEFVDREGVFRTSAAKKKVKEIKGEINQLYKTYDTDELSSVSFRKQLDAILCQSDFDTPSIRASLLKEILHCLPEPLCVNGYSKIFEVIPQMQKYEDKLQLLNLLFLILPRPNQFFLLHLLTLFNKIAENSNVNKMNLRNLAICFAPNFFLSQMSPTKNAPNSKEYSKFEEMQKSMPALIEATEMMIQHVDIITMLPNSFIQQLRAYNSEQTKNGQKFFGFFGRREKSQKGDSILNTLVESSGRFAYPPMSGADPSTYSINVKVFDSKNNHDNTVPIVISDDTKVRNIISEIHINDWENNWELFEEKGNLRNYRRLDMNAKMKAVYTNNKSAEFHLKQKRNTSSPAIVAKPVQKPPVRRRHSIQL